VLPNAWDVASALAVERAGARAVATSSGAVAALLGYPDGEVIPVAEMLDMVGRIAAAVELPVTADLEAGYGDPVATAQAAWEAGAVGMNLEDGGGDPGAHAERVAAVRAAVPELVINARIDTTEVDDVVDRAHGYLEAGADCVYPIFVAADAIAELVPRISGPVNVLARPGSPPVSELAAIGVRRISVGSGLHRASLAFAETAARQLLERGTLAW
jgi:2-methylisocitrate lyase-like PEP mutase family enzyme